MTIVFNLSIGHFEQTFSLLQTKVKEEDFLRVLKRILANTPLNGNATLFHNQEEDSVSLTFTMFSMPRENDAADRLRLNMEDLPENVTGKILYSNGNANLAVVTLHSKEIHMTIPRDFNIPEHEDYRINIQPKIDENQESVRIYAKDITSNPTQVCLGWKIQYKYK